MALINDFMSLIYPRYCEACNALLYKHETLICNLCEINLPKSNYHLQPNNPVALILSGRVPLNLISTLYIFEKGGKVQQMLHAIKYENQTRLAEMLGEKLGLELKNNSKFNSVDFLIPIPLHKNKLKSRGYNQSEAFAKGLNKILKVKLETHLLIKTIETSSQTKKRKFERWENVESVFELLDDNRLKNKHVLLVDDVITTGATIEAAWQKLKTIEGLTISLACIAFAEK